MALHTTNLALYLFPIQWVKTLLISRVIYNTGFIIIPRTLTMLRTRNSTFGTVWWSVCVLDLDIGIVSVCVCNAYVCESLSPEPSYKRSVKYPVCRADVTIIQHNTACNIISRSTASQREETVYIYMPVHSNETHKKRKTVKLRREKNECGMCACPCLCEYVCNIFSINTIPVRSSPLSELSLLSTTLITR